MTQPIDAKQDLNVADPPTDGISSLRFSPTADLLAASSWDNNVRIYEISNTGQSQGKAMYSHEGPVLSVDWSKDGSKIVSAGADKAARLYDLQTMQASQVAAHDAPIRSVRWVDSPSGPILVTGSWDKTVKFWDMKSPNPVITVQLPERCYALDVSFPLMVVGTAERHLEIFNLNSPQRAYKSMQSTLKWQTRCITCFPSANGFALGSIEGRVAIQYIEDKDASNNFSFKCHREPLPRDQSNVYSVNDILFHPVHGTFTTVGSDGTYSFWDKDSKSRLKWCNSVGGTIPCSAFNRSGSIFAYAVSYDWSKGYQSAVAANQNMIKLHATKDDEVKPRKKR